MNRINEIHLLHHTHADFGYTDLCSTALAYLGDYLRQAVALAHATAHFPEEARLHFTCEVTYALEEFLARATAEEVGEWNGLVERGQCEVGIMPFHTSALLTRAEWDALIGRSADLLARYRPRCCVQNDINGLPWGLLPLLKEQGVEYVLMGVNTYSGGVPLKPPCGFWWEGPDGSRLLVWLGMHYCQGYFLFHDSEWRRGPIPSYADIWFNPPRGGEIFDDSTAGLHRAHRVLCRTLETEFTAYPHRVLGAQFTNMWRMDNDPPSLPVCRFVRAWNEAGLSPTLRLSTPSKFLDRIKAEAGDSLPVRRGDWGEWWADGVTSMPLETALALQAKRLLTDLPRASELLGSPPTDPRTLADTWKRAGFFTEHTFGSHNALAAPYGPLSLGGWAQKANFAYQTEEESRILQCGLMRQAPDYRPLSETRFLTVLNPGTGPRAGWVSISSQALRTPAHAARDTETGALYLLEELSEPLWSAPDPTQPRPFEVPDDIFSFRPAVSRFHIPPLAGGKRRRFELVQADAPGRNRAAATDQNSHFAWSWDSAAGRLLSLRDRTTGNEWIDPGAEFALGQPVFELPQGFGARQKLLERKSVETFTQAPSIDSWTSAWHPQGARYRLVFSHPHCHRIEQVWEMPATAARIEVATTFWLRETLDPQALYLALPFRLPGCTVEYSSLGYPTRAGVDQMPGTCGEHHSVLEGLVFHTEGCALALATPDTPLVCLDRRALRSGRTTFTPTRAHVFPIVTENYWVTNFPHTKAAKLTVRHSFTTGIDPVGLLTSLQDGLWVFPSR